MYKTILIPVDLTHQERVPAMMQAARKMGDESASITLVNVIEDVPGYLEGQLPQGVLDRLVTQAEGELKVIAGESGPDVELAVRCGQPASEILALAGEKKADLIVIASHRPGFGDFLIGSTAARVVRHADCSVHVMR
ncbi:MAG: universal stress protein [Pseudomonadota bacterium]|uniref:universal stress protein n=1 Tax=Fodinicurvata fenggangensis TaxID=1121830 RepID=UPI00047C89E8|nr:universal stress protein [Fodinicurvata fenggangensis]